MHSEPIVQPIAAMIALAGFVVAILGGLAVDNSGIIVLQRGLLAMAFCYAVGMAIGWSANIAIIEFLEDYRDQRPVRQQEALDLHRELDRVFADSAS
ncbi:MAG: hypothetical protein KF757_07480 [Phycisphaeraceae bacterium]|nr:hypothetical protein [Phycisphaeraceae bacterium]MCW5764326.1 hypothetical protein [Phycisphaeraceae bacterium]